MELLTAIFPWIEDERAALDLRVQQIGRRANDYALRNFLLLLVWFRRVLLQDAAVIYHSHPSCQIFGFAPFNTTAFKQFSAAAPASIVEAEQAASIALQNLPEHMVRSVRGIITDVNMSQHQQSNEMQELKNTVANEMSSIKDMLALALGSKQGRKPNQKGQFLTLSVILASLTHCIIQLPWLCLYLNSTTTQTHASHPSHHRHPSFYPQLLSLHPQLQFPVSPSTFRVLSPHLASKWNPPHLRLSHIHLLPQASTNHLSQRCTSHLHHQYLSRTNPVAFPIHWCRVRLILGH
jgi:hypothetical protein